MNPIYSSQGMMLDDATPEELSPIFSVEESQPEAESPIVAIQGQGARPPLFLVHGVGGGMLWGYANLARHLGDDQPVYAITCRGSRGLPEHATIEEMAAEYVRELRRFQPYGPYQLGGYCFGGNVAYEMARILRQQGQSASAVVLMNSVPANCRYDQIRWTPVITAKFIYNLCFWTGHFLRWPAARRRQFLKWKFRSLQRRLAGWGRRAVNCNAEDEADELVDLLAVPNPQQRQIWESHVRAFTRYYPEPFNGHVSVFRSRGHQAFCTFEDGYGWDEFALDGVSVRIVPDEHENILEEPHVAALADELRVQLAAARSNAKNFS